MAQIGLSVIIPVYNAADWIGPTLEHLDVALEGLPFKTDIVVVDDGSQDGSADRAREVKMSSGATVNVISQPNRGRYLARKTGIKAAKAKNILFVDSRVFTGADSLRYLYKKIKNNQDQIWNGHVIIDKKGSIFTRFWDAIVCIGWRRYFRNPTETQYSVKDFDYYPKGTGFIYLPKDRLVAAMKHFEATTNDIKHSSDDTLLLRFMNERQDIHLSPEFNCLYHGRTNGKSFLKHAYHRGEFFIDGFLRPGTRFFIPLLVVLLASIALAVFLIINPMTALLVLLVGAICFMLGLFFVAVALGVEWRDALSLAVLSVPFSIVYLAGLWRGVIRKLSPGNGSHAEI